MATPEWTRHGWGRWAGAPLAFGWIWMGRTGEHQEWDTAGSSMAMDGQGQEEHGNRRGVPGWT